jgi:protein ImuB
VKYSYTPTAVRSDAFARRKTLKLQESDRTAVGVLAARPLTLLTCPLEIRVMVTPSGDLEGFPVFFTHESEVRRLSWVVGPERIAGIWWTGHDKTRDYFDVTDEEGKRFWIFRVLETWRWFLHGFF